MKTCPKCQTQITQESIFCSFCGEKQIVPSTAEQEIASQTSAPQTVSGSGRKTLSFPVFFFISVGLLVGALAAAGPVTEALNSNVENSPQEESGTSSENRPLSGSSSEYRNPEPTVTPEDPDAWVPVDFTALSPMVAYQPLEPSEMDCGFSSAHGCFQAFFTSKESCEAFVTVSFKVDGVKIDDSIDSSYLQPGTASLMSFVSFDRARYSGEGNVQLEEVSCY